MRCRATILVVGLLVGGAYLFTFATAECQVLIDHTSTDLSQVPAPWIETAAAELHIAYNHTSHGSHLMSGMNALANFPDFGDSYVWSYDGTMGLEVRNGGIPCSVPDLSQTDTVDENGVLPWVTCTRDFLDDPANSRFNVVMWSWCSIAWHNAQLYVDNMELLIAEYPDVTFVFMTGHAEGTGEDTTPGSVHYNNQLVRQHCRENGRVLFDFGDIEAYNPDGLYFWNLNLWDSLYYDGGGNWAEEWITANPDTELARITTGAGVEGYDGCYDCAHSESPEEAKLNCVLKGRAAWWMYARLAGWEPDLIFSCGFENGSTSRWSGQQ